LKNSEVKQNLLRKVVNMLHYIYQVWIDCKVTFVISEQSDPKELQDLKARGGKVIDARVSENDLGDVIVVQ
jgi:hypothetical protein